MKRVALTLVLFPITALAAPATITGNWKIHTSVAGNESDSTCSFVQKDSDLTGSCKTDSGDAKLTGKVDGANVTWSYASEYNGTALTITFKGKLDDGKITGQNHVDPFGVDGDFSAVPVIAK